ncbi:hypothetical protein [Cylindrospermopsis raciborskii]|uniref:hypothetical protein n=1 Tax=Cylindrospermopsis raciborskii TaxID=77022 RepID=UPI0015E12926|nr:hypothetical protein [Cylindrospermopsis raciborskii]
MGAGDRIQELSPDSFSRENFEGVEGRAFRNFPWDSSQGKNLNILKGDREALPLGDRS